MNLLFQVMLFTWVHRIPIPRAVVPGCWGRNQEPAPLLLFKHSKKASQRACEDKQPKEGTTGGGQQQWRQLPATPRRRGHSSTAAGASRWTHPPHPSWLVHLGYFSQRRCSIWRPKPQMGTTEMVLAILGGGPAAPALPVLLIDWWWSGGCFLFIRGRESGTTAVVLPRTQAAPELNNSPSLGRGATNPSVILLLLFPNELN